MFLESERNEIVNFGRKMIASRLTAGTGGNLSVIDRRQQLVAISPSGMDYDQILPEDIVITDLDGRVVEGDRKPSSELGLHLSLYRARADIAAVVHTHPPFATTLASLELEIPPFHYLVAFSGKKVPLAPYATYGTPELAQCATQAIGTNNAVLLAKHGMVTVGPSLKAAFATSEVLELVSQLYFQARCIGTPTLLPDAEMDKLLVKFKTYGQ